MHDLDHHRRPAPTVSYALQQALHSGDLLERLPVAIYTCDADGGIVHYNERAAELWGRSPEPHDPRQRFCGSLRMFHPDGRPLPHAQCPMADVLRTGRAARNQEVVIERPDGTRVTALVSIDPLFGADGRITGAVNCFQDITERKRAEERLSDRERWFRELLGALPAAVYTTDAEGRITFYNQAAAELWGCRPKLGDGQWCGSWRLYWPDGRPMAHGECPMAVALKEARPIRGAEAVAERPDGRRVPFIPYPTPLRDASGALVGAVNMLVDITERKQAETRLRALVDELNHRVKNTLATVQSLAAQTLRGAGAHKVVRETFEARLFALSRAHDELTRRRWESADFSTIVQDIFAPHQSAGGDRIRLQGGRVSLLPKVALTLAMVLHELATNAAKYGALSVAGGVLAVSWSVEEREGARALRIEWQESGGPAVRRPERRGFGSRLLERGITKELKGAAQILFEPAGIRCRMDIPLPLDGA